ncbi:Smr/MutS family protein [Mesomycoplasma lagogenitalium]|uniref:Smr/MutS family protein n=1 Tax=Mesomycoplasma lagogenitalium TaxID=171286 RepID=A0ABY8LV67_9BACT|nr:Smr/MutS family protein [Mesomycoplasma lagogenitalium]WGI36418.1 Smr/MutS family protein [Mesomycoplasma lagogenitalium]
MNNNWDRKYTIDLHGQNSDDAIIKLSNALFSFSNNENLDELEIIVGKGTGVLKIFIRDFLEKEGHFFIETEERDSFIVLKNNLKW